MERNSKTEDTLKSKEFPYSGVVINGFVALLAVLVVIGFMYWYIFNSDISLDPEVNALAFLGAVVLTGVLVIGFFKGLVMLEPNEARVILFFGKYKGTLRRTGFFWMNPFNTVRKITLRLNNLDGSPIKVNDRSGNPIMIGMVLVWKVEDTYRALFDVVGNGLAALQNFVSIQADAALREVAAQFSYDDDGHQEGEMTLRSGGTEINAILVEKLNDRLAMAGVKVTEARINYLAYAPEIAAVMLKRQQADAIIAAREKIVEGAVSMVQMALESLEKQKVVELSNDRRATIVGNLLMVLCADDSPQTVIPTSGNQ